MIDPVKIVRIKIFSFGSYLLRNHTSWGFIAAGCRESTNSLMMDHSYHHIIVRFWSLVITTICVCSVFRAPTSSWSCQCAQIAESRKVVEPIDVQPSLCASIIRVYGYPCEEITVQTLDGFLLGLQHIPYGLSSGTETFISKPSVYLQHGAIQAGDDWVLNSPDESLAFILADQGFDVWIGNLRATTWSHGHITLTPNDAKFWDWSFDQHAAYDLPALVGYVYSAVGHQIYYVGHSQGSIIAFAAFTMAETGMTDMVKAAALLSPIAYLQHTTSQLIKVAADFMLDEAIAVFGISEFSIQNEVGTMLVNWACKQDGVSCEDIIAATWGPDCCFNHSRYGYYLIWEPQPTSIRNIQHLAQMVRGSNFSMFDYGTDRNLKVYNQLTPPLYDLRKIPTAFPMLLCSGGQDALADPQDVKRLLSELVTSDVTTLYIANYAHADFVVGIHANSDVYPEIIAYFQKFETPWSFEDGHVIV